MESLPPMDDSSAVPQPPSIAVLPQRPGCLRTYIIVAALALILEIAWGLMLFATMMSTSTDVAAPRDMMPVASTCFVPQFFFGLLGFVYLRGLWRLQQSARHFAIVLHGLTTLLLLYAIITSRSTPERIALAGGMLASIIIARWFWQNYPAIGTLKRQELAALEVLPEMDDPYVHGKSRKVKKQKERPGCITWYVYALITASLVIPIALIMELARTSRPGLSNFAGQAILYIFIVVVAILVLIPVSIYMRGLWRMRNWARVLTMIIFGAILISGLLQLIQTFQEGIVAETSLTISSLLISIGVAVWFAVNGNKFD